MHHYHHPDPCSQKVLNRGFSSLRWPMKITPLHTASCVLHKDWWAADGKIKKNVSLSDAFTHSHRQGWHHEPPQDLMDCLDKRRAIQLALGGCCCIPCAISHLEQPTNQHSKVVGIKSMWLCTHLKRAGFKLGVRVMNFEVRNDQRTDTWRRENGHFLLAFFFDWRGKRSLFCVCTVCARLASCN